jgi:hypothetical protein
MWTLRRELQGGELDYFGMRIWDCELGLVK